MQATGSYHLPIPSYLKAHGIFVTIVNPLIMKKYVAMTLRKGKTDKMDSLKIANYGIDNWFRITDYQATDKVYEELRILGRQYAPFMRIESKLALTNILDRTMPGIKTLLKNNSETPDRDKLNDFVEKYWHYDNITKKSEKQFTSSYIRWTKKKRYHQSEAKARKIYAIATDSIPTLPSSTPSTKMLVLESVRVLREIDRTLSIILTQMRELANSLKEYKVILAMPGVGETLAPRLIALKKESEGKAPKVAKIAALNKFLRIYYARVKEACIS